MYCVTNRILKCIIIFIFPYNHLPTSSICQIVAPASYAIIKVVTNKSINPFVGPLNQRFHNNLGGAVRILCNKLCTYRKKVFFSKIYTAKCHFQTSKMSIFFHVSASHELRHLVLSWLLQSSSSPPTVQCPLVNLLWSMTIFILRKCPYHFNCLLWILSKIDCLQFAPSSGVWDFL